jgi:hypothetical protein
MNHQFLGRVPRNCPPITNKRGFTFVTLSNGIWNLAMALFGIEKLRFEKWTEKKTVQIHFCWSLCCFSLIDIYTKL